jgi:U32 family peptidase
MSPAPELSAPAGSFESIRAACDHGADAVYIGIDRYNLRAHCANFTVDELGPAIEYVRNFDRKIYCALNIMPDDRALTEIETIIRSCRALKCLPDAFIVSDPGVLSLCRRLCENVPLHLSTQTGTFNSGAARFWKMQGVKRVILPRELSLGQIAAITSAAAMETEMFVHGAMCVSVSGRCLLGAYLARRHPNWGDCSQPCRLKYRIAPCQDETTDDHEWLTVMEEVGPPGKGGSFILNSKDLNTLSILPQIVATGVSSLKIEGRNKSAHYVASAVKVYREALDSFNQAPDRYFVREEWSQELERLDHRPYTTGFYGEARELQEIGRSHEKSALRIAGSVKALFVNGKAVVDVKNPFTAGDSFNVLPVQNGLSPFDIRLTSLTDMNGNPMERAFTSRVVIVSADKDLRVGDMLRKVDPSKKKQPARASVPISLIHP